MLCEAAHSQFRVTYDLRNYYFTNSNRAFNTWNSLPNLEAAYQQLPYAITFVKKGKWL